MSQSPVSLQVSAVLTDMGGNPLSNETINFAYKLTSASAFTAAGSGTTDSTGMTSVSLSIAPGVYDIMASFPGTSTYLASSLTVQYDTTSGVITYPSQFPLLPLVGVAALTTAVVSLAVFLRKRPRQPQR